MAIYHCDERIPEVINRLLEGREYTVDDTGQSGAAVWFFEDMVLKAEKADESTAGTVAMLRWLKGRLPVPEVLACEVSGETHYLLMSRARGEMLCAPGNMTMETIEKTVELYAEALKLLWQVDISDCPRIYSLEDDLAKARRKLERGEFDMDDCEPETFGPGGFESPEKLLEWLENNKPEPETVLSHGDFCMPNVFVENGCVSCYIDVGDMGAGDRWRDIALCWRSLKHNCSGMYTGVDLGDRTELLFEKLGIAPDWDKIRYYVLLDEFF